MRSGWVRVNGVCTWRGDLTLPTILGRTNAACSLSSHLQCENLLLDLLALGDKCIYCCVGIGAGMINVRPLPFLDQFLDVDSLGHVRYGSLADITERSRHVRFTPIADIRRCGWDVR